MEAENNDFAERMDRARDAFRLIVLEKRSLREAAAELGVSHVTAARDAKAYSKHLADERSAETVEERRARLIAELEDQAARALEVFRYCMSEAKGGKKPLAAVAALNSYNATFTHLRAIQGADTPKEIRQDVDQHIRIVWDESDDPALQHQYPNE